jgi:hypothetical protein
VSVCGSNPSLPESAIATAISGLVMKFIVWVRSSFLPGKLRL